MRYNRCWKLISLGGCSLLVVLVLLLVHSFHVEHTEDSGQSCALKEITDSRTALIKRKTSESEKRYVADNRATKFLGSPFIPIFSGDAWVFINGGEPCFSVKDLKQEKGIILLNDLDQLGRCGSAFGYLGPETLPKEERTGIGMIKPSGWQTIKYDFIDGKYLYHRCHLIAYELSGINDDERNLITGTRSMNVEAMLPFENQIRGYISETSNHVVYRVTPFFDEDNLVAKGVQIEALSVEDHGQGIFLNVFCFNVQNGVTIDYLSGESSVIVESGSSEEVTEESSTNGTIEYVPSEGVTYVINSNTLRFHMCDCQSVYEMKDEHRVEFFGTRDELIDSDYIPCGRCNP